MCTYTHYTPGVVEIDSPRVLQENDNFYVSGNARNWDPDIFGIVSLVTLGSYSRETSVRLVTSTITK